MSLLHKIALGMIPGVGPRLAKNLLQHIGSVEEIFSASVQDLIGAIGIGSAIAKTIRAQGFMRQAEQECIFVERHHIQPLWIEDRNYPHRLQTCDDAPPLLYYKGSADLNNQYIVSIVGTRNATAYGKRLCEDLICELSDFNPLIVSGLAYGIDVIAHRAAMQNQLSTLGVVGHGLDRIYPSVHREVAAAMLDQGGLLTEFPSGTKPDRPHFPMRNRLIAGLADVTIVVEAGIKGGALITAEMANSYNRDVCAFPGSIHQTYSEGCNYLIKTNRAHLIRQADDLRYLMNWENVGKKNITPQLSILPPTLSKDEQKVFVYLQQREQATVDDIAIHLDWPQSKLAIILLEMEMNDVLLSLPGKVYRCLSR
ncbi:DNA-processing protein DprA [Sphingobacterium sp. lm-10]|uniref:DNA-processing protein DprA n=1 Tax=Sphingobacterium sp. lm-10 TaxID=2944904 RepID=UPI0020206D77|nr:DNA-processing protein DprA [Sphingobacterium sp. lm-10]MCL7989025.1 DNA-processing protein DprA [Sphingobacterium sp. lm-10]